MRRVYVQALSYCGTAEVLKVRRDGRLLVETPSGRTHRVRESECRDLRAPPSPSLPRLELVPDYTGESRAVPKPEEPERVPAYLAWLRTQPCAVCGRMASEASHHPPKMGGTLSRKCSDMRALPLCHSHHMAHHSKPLPRDVVEEEIAKHARRWVRSL